MAFINGIFQKYPEETFFIADIAANHDGSLERAKKLIELAADAGANAAKFQNFRANTIVSSRGFSELGTKIGHQAKWENDVVDVYSKAELPIEWTDELRKSCKTAGLEYFTAPYDLDFIDFFENKMNLFKIGSGDITWRDSLVKISKTGKPVLLATGASNFDDVAEAVKIFEENGSELVIMQCNTNYTGDVENFSFLNLSAISEYKEKFPNAGLGLSDHTPGHIAVLGAVTLGARFIEKHFTDDKSRQGPDHAFSLDPSDWRRMVDDTRILESALGDGKKKLEANEVQAQIVQRRALRFSSELRRDTIISRGDLIALRPIPADGISPMDIEKIIGKKLIRDVAADELVRYSDFA